MFLKFYKINKNLIKFCNPSRKKLLCLNIYSSFMPLTSEPAPHLNRSNIRHYAPRAVEQGAGGVGLNPSVA